MLPRLFRFARRGPVLAGIGGGAHRAPRPSRRPALLPGIFVVLAVASPALLFVSRVLPGRSLRPLRCASCSPPECPAPGCAPPTPAGGGAPSPPVVGSALREEIRSALRNEMGKLGPKKIREELHAMGVQTDDVFEKAELVNLLVDRVLQAKFASEQAEPSPGSTAPRPEAAGLDVKADLLKETQSMRISELRRELASRGIAWADVFEKSELAERLAAALTEERKFSASGRFRPGVVTELSGAELEAELQDSPSPLFLDVFAPWCGPCKVMAPYLDSAAKALGSRARVAKLNSDTSPDALERLGIRSFPTLILFDRSGKEIARRSGSLQEEQLVGMVAAAGF